MDAAPPNVKQVRQHDHILSIRQRGISTITKVKNARPKTWLASRMLSSFRLLLDVSECLSELDLACARLLQVINMEWSGFWSSHLPRTDIDEQLDSESVNPGDAVISHFLMQCFLTYFSLIAL